MKKTLLSATFITSFLLVGCGVGTESDVATDDSSLTSSSEEGLNAPGARHLPPPCPPGLVAVPLPVCPPPPPPGMQPPRPVMDGGALPPPFHPCFVPPPLPPRCEGPAGGFDGGLPPPPGAGGPGAPRPPPLFVCLPPLPGGPGPQQPPQP